MKRRSYLKGVIGLGTAFILSPVACDMKGDELTPIEIEHLIAAMADSILPETDTPGAIQAGVPTFITETWQHYLSEKNKEAFLNGLIRTESYSRDSYNRSFSQCPMDVRINILTYLESKETYRFAILNKIRNRFFGPSFIGLFKQLTVQGYCTSHAGATKALRYDAVPGHYESCVLMAENTRSWATK